MKKLFSIVAFLMLTVSIFAQSEKPQTFEGSNGLKFEFSSTMKKFGNVPQNKPEIATHVYKLKNTGSAPILISDVKPSCGCTTPKWTTTPIMPGQEGEVKTIFNAAKEGKFMKNVTVTVKGMEDKPIKLYYEGTVVVKK